MKITQILRPLLMLGMLGFHLAWAQSHAEVATIAPYTMATYNQALQPWWQQPSVTSMTLPQRLVLASAWFLGKPYQLFPNGEGPTGTIDQGPLYRSDVFDCTTYVVTVIALAKSHDLPSFQQQYRALMYQHGQVDFFHRNHFATIDLNANNEAAGVFDNLTPMIKDKRGHSLTQTLTTDINKPAWYRDMRLSRVRLLQSPTSTELAKITALLHHYQRISQSKPYSVDYIPLTTLVSAQGEVNTAVLKQIPDESIIEWVYFDPTDKAKYGTDLQVSHMGFVFTTPKGQMFREASSIYHQVTDVPLNTYLRNMRQDPTMLGIHIEGVN